MIEAEVGVPAPLELMLPDGKDFLGVRAYLQASDGTEIATIDLPHMSRGRYAALHTFTEAGYVYADFIIFSDDAYAHEDLLYTRRSAVYKVVPPVDFAASFAAIPSEVWGYQTRLFTNDISQLATKADILDLKNTSAKIQYVNKMTTTFNTETGIQEVVVWAEKDGNLIEGDACSIAVRNAAGSNIWGATLANPNPDGIYRFMHPIDALGDENYYIVIGIVVDGELRRNVQTFFTVA